MPRKQTKEIFVGRAINKFGENKFDYSKVEYNGVDTKVIISCSLHGEFKQTPYLHIKSKHGCPKCGKIETGKKISVSKENFFEKCNNIHKNKYDYSKVSFKTVREKIIIICPEHGEFKQIADDHQKGSGCQKCAGVYQYNTETFIEKAKEVNSYYDLSEVKYVNTRTKIKITCPKHGPFEIRAGQYLKGIGCIHCGREACIEKTRMPQEEFIEKCIKKFGEDKFDYSEVKYVNSNTKIKIICRNCDYIFTPKPSNHLHNESGCPKCANCLQLTTEIFIERSNKVHNNKYDYSKTIYKSSKCKVTIICPVHGEFKQQASGHQKGRGCDACGGTKEILHDEFIKQCKEKHGNTYDYSKVVYINKKEKIIIICKKGHGEFKQCAGSHLKGGYGCSKCGKDKLAKLFSFTQEEFIEKAKKVHGDKYNYSKSDYKNNRTKVIIICKEHGEFKQTPLKHINTKQGCKRCCNSCGYSKAQIQWLNFLSVHKEIQHAETEGGEYSVPNTLYSADGYETKTNTIFEYHGSYFHGDIRYHNPDDYNEFTKTKFGVLLKRTLKREIILRNLGYNYHCIWGADWSRGIKAVIKLQRQWKSKTKNA